jgi:syntaxin 1B/2/3
LCLWPELTSFDSFFVFYFLFFFLTASSPTTITIMARDRLAAMRAQQGAGYNDAPLNPYNGAGGYQSRRPNPYAQQSDRYEMTDVNNGSTVPLTAGMGDDMSAFYAEISSIQDSLRTYNDNVTRISDLHSRSLNNLDDAAQARNAQQLEELVEQTSRMSTDLKGRIKALQKKGGSGRDGQIRKQQTQLVKQKFVEAIQSYQQVEQQYRAKYKQRWSGSSR